MPAGIVEPMDATYQGWVKEAAGLGSEARFAVAHPDPFLVVYDPLVREGSALETGKFSAVRVFHKTPLRPKVDAEVRRVRKAPRVGNVTPMITVGRAANNDIILGDDSVSNFHAYFVHERSLWHLSDAESSNGTRVDGTLVQGPQALGENCPVAFGSIRCRFLLPGAFFRLLTSVGGEDEA